MKDKTLGSLAILDQFLSLEREFYEPHNPTPLSNPELLFHNKTLLRELGFDPKFIESEGFKKIANGHVDQIQYKAIAQEYAGHQFGRFNPSLGDGRSVLIAEVETENGRIDLVLKGAGKTPFSRKADGRAAIRTCIKELLNGEALHGLGIASTRCLSIVRGDEQIYRHSFTDAAMMIRMASTHVRIGTLEKYFFLKNADAVKKLADYCIDRCYPHCRDNVSPYFELLRSFVKKQARLIAAWQSNGFIHGVMNTDNTSINAETLDLVSCEFMKTYVSNKVIDPDSDEHGMYAYDQQPAVGLWQCNCLAKCFSLLLDREQIMNALKDYEQIYQQEYLSRMRNKLGLSTSQSDDQNLIESYLVMLENNQLDYHKSFLALEKFNEHIPAYFQVEKEYDQLRIKKWFDNYNTRIKLEKNDYKDRIDLMRSKNPILILRKNHIEKAIEACKAGELDYLSNLVDQLQDPFKR